VPDGDPQARGGTPDRRGLDAVTLEMVKTLHAQFVESHSDIHTTYIAAHEREHEQAAASQEAALDLAARRLAEVEKAVREHFDTILQERDNRYEERFAASQLAVQAALAEQEKARAAAFISAEKAIAAAFDSAREAIAKSEASVIKQADATFVKIDKMQEMLGQVMPKNEVLSRFESITESQSDIRTTQDTYLRDIWDRLKTLEASKQGQNEQRTETQQMVPWLIALISLIGVAVTIAIAFGGKSP
jgi:hypothetical protein